MSSLKVFVVDDEQDNVDFLVAVLGGASFDPVGFTDGKAALEAMMQEAPALAILDIQMPNLNGFQLLKKMRDEDVLRDVPVIFLSAIGAVTGEEYDPDRIEKEYGVRPNAFVSKPIDEESLLSAIEAVRNP